MAGSLIKIDEEIVTSAVASVTLTGIDSTYDVYMVKYNNVTPTTNTNRIDFRVTVSGTPDTSANYDNAYKGLRSDSTFINGAGTNVSYYNMVNQQVASGKSLNGIMYLFNFNNSSEYSFWTNENAMFWSGSNHLLGQQGGAVHTVAQTCDGVHFFASASSNIESGTFTLYGLKK